MAIPSTTSKGLMSVSHFTSSKRSMDMDEPIYLNLFTVSIQAEHLPAGLRNEGYGQDDINIILEGLRQVTGLTTQPGVGTAVQKYRNSDRVYAGGAPSQTHLQIGMSFELNLRREDNGTDNNYTYKFLRKWHDLIWDPQTGRATIKKNYVCPQMVITMQDKEGVPFWQWTIYNIFPSQGLEAPAISYDNTGIWQAMTVNFVADYFDEAIL